MKRGKKLSPELREEQIIKKAFNVFSRLGYRGSTTKMLASAAGINELTLFRHFRNKENLFKKVIEHHSFLARIEELEPSLEHLPYKNALNTLAESFLETLYRNKNLVKIMAMEAYTHPTYARMIHKNLIQKVFRHFEGYLAHVSKLNKIRILDRQVATRAFFGMIYFYFINQEFFLEREIKKFNHHHVINEFVELFLKGTLKDGK